MVNRLFTPPAPLRHHYAVTLWSSRWTGHALGDGTGRAGHGEVGEGLGCMVGDGGGALLLRKINLPNCSIRLDFKVILWDIRFV